MPGTRFVATLAETVGLLRSFFTKSECALLPEEAVATPPAGVSRTSDASSLSLLTIREKSGRRWMPPLLLWPAELGEPRVEWKPGDGGRLVPDWTASSASVRIEFPAESIEGRILRLGSGAAEWREEHAGAPPPLKLRAFYADLVGRLRRSMSSYVLKRRVRIGKEAKRMVLEGEAQFLWRGAWYPPLRKK
jgi:hypothetical protein